MVCRAAALVAYEAMASFHSRLNTEPKRVHWLFHGVTSESGDGLLTQKSYPERSSLTSTCQPQPCTSVVSAACCGRGRVRRRLHRPSYQFPEFTLTFSTLNVQSLRFDRIAHRGKLQELITLLRHHDIHICCLQEVRTQGAQLFEWYIEEYCFVVYGIKVAIALVNSVPRKWESAGRQYVVRPNASNEHVLSFIIPLEFLDLSSHMQLHPKYW